MEEKRGSSMNESLIDKLKRVVEDHHNETGEFVNKVSIIWDYNFIKNSIELDSIKLKTTKEYQK